MVVENFILYGDSHENYLLKEALKYLPDGEVVGNVAIYTTTPRFGIVLNREICTTREIILLNCKIFPNKYDPEDKVFRFLVFTLLHECAHVSGISDECAADDKAIEWYNKYISENKLGIDNFTKEEKKATDDLITSRDYIFVSNKGDISEYISALVGESLVEAFISKCKSNGKGVTTVVKEFIKSYLER